MPPDRFEVDLTSVCVRRGAVQLPFRLKDAFSEGPVAAVDADGGSPLALAFHPPRELAGLGPFFEAHALRANDSVALAFTEAGLEVQAIRRERSSRRSAAARDGTSSSVAERTAPEPRSTASPGGAPGTSEPASSPTAGDGSAARSAASQTPPSLRMEVPRTSVPAGEGTGSDAEPQGAAGAPRWEPLDVTAAAGDHVSSRASGASRPPAEPPGSQVRVREVRRSRAASEDAPASEQGQASADAGVEAPPPAREEEPSAASRRDTAPEREQRGPGLFGLARRLARGRGADADAYRGDGRAASRSGRPPQARAGGADGDAGQGRLWPADAPTDARAERTDGSDVAGGRLAAEAVTQDSPRGSGAQTVGAAQPATQVEAVTVEAEAAWEPEAVRRDVAAVRSYLAGPEVPAIVRTERVAEAVGLAVARVERALERVSEESEELSRIRAGAYMLRRPSQG